MGALDGSGRGNRRDVGLVGRGAEFEQLGWCAAKVLAGEPWLVGVEGEAGIGKSLLVREWLRSLEGFAVLGAASDRSETDYPYGVIGQLTARVDPTVRAEFPLIGRDLSGSAPPYSVGGDLLLLLGELQPQGPVAVVVDDVQWMDRPSMQALGFVLRRLWADRVLVVLVARSGGLGEVFERLLEGERAMRLAVRGLDDASVAELARQESGVEPGPGLAARLREHTGRAGGQVFRGQGPLGRGVARRAGRPAVGTDGCAVRHVSRLR